MSRDQTRFYIPQVRMWNWKLVSPAFVKLQYQRAAQSYRETDQALYNLEQDLEKINQEIKGQWAQGSVQVMRAFESRYKEVRAENKRIAYVRVKLREAMDQMESQLINPEWTEWHRV